MVAHLGSGASGWGLDPLILAALTVTVTAYALRAQTLSQRGRGAARWRQVCFYAGLAVLAVALLSPLEGAGEHVFYMHMIQHLLIVDAAALLILLGLSGPLLRPLLAKPGMLRLRVLANPLVALPVWALVLYAWHLPALYEAALGSGALHALEHASFLAAGMLMWAAVIEPLPGPRWFGAAGKAAYVLAVRALGAILASLFLWAGEPLYPGYAPGQREWGLAPLTDQAIAGGIMFVEGAVVTLAVFAWIFLRWVGEPAPSSTTPLRPWAPARRRAPAPPRSPPSP